MLPAFIERDAVRQQEKSQRLAGPIADALARREPEPPLLQENSVLAYPRLWETEGVNAGNAMPKRTLEGAAIWRMSVGGVALRDSRSPDGPALVFTGATWDAFLRGVKRQRDFG